MLGCSLAGYLFESCQGFFHPTNVKLQRRALLQSLLRHVEGLGVESKGFLQGLGVILLGPSFGLLAYVLVFVA